MPEPDDKSPVDLAVEHAVELFVYAPVGLLFEGASLLPHLIEKGRGHVSVARMVGRFAVRHRGSMAAKTLGRLQDQAAGVLGFVGDSVTAPSTPVAPARRPQPRPAQPRPAAAKAPARPGRAAPSATRAATPSAAGLAIPDYDGLSASQVVNRLAGLSGPELEAVQRYEAATRGRKTILSKVAQLQGA